MDRSRHNEQACRSQTEEEPTDCTTTDLCDRSGSEVRVAGPLLRDYGGAKSFCRRITTVRLFEDNVLVREASEDDGRGRVPVVDEP